MTAGKFDGTPEGHEMHNFIDCYFMMGPLRNWSDVYLVEENGGTMIYLPIEFKTTEKS